MNAKKIYSDACRMIEAEKMLNMMNSGNPVVLKIEGTGASEILLPASVDTAELDLCNTISKAIQKYSQDLEARIIHNVR